MTLMEIMVVIAIIGTIATVVAVNVFGTFSKSNVKTTEIKMQRVTEAIMTEFYNNLGKLPKDLAVLDMKTTDAWGNELKYEVSGNNFKLISFGEDGQKGGEGANADLVMDRSGELLGE